MKVGMIFECGPSGPDKKVCEYLAQCLLSDIVIASITLSSKPGLISGCGSAAATLLDEGCERIIIVWDLYPPWRKKGQRPCRREDREAISDSLARAGVTSSQVYLVCIEEELEAWVLADERAINQVLSTAAHPVRIPRIKKPEGIRNPKGYLRKTFREHSRYYYSDLIHAAQIIKALPDCNRIKHCPSFARFAFKLTGREL